MNYPEYARALHFYAFYLHLNTDGKKALATVFGEDLLAVLIASLERYLQLEGE